MLYLRVRCLRRFLHTLYYLKLKWLTVRCKVLCPIEPYSASSRNSIPRLMDEIQELLSRPSLDREKQGLLGRPSTDDRLTACWGGWEGLRAESHSCNACGVWRVAGSEICQCQTCQWRARRPRGFGGRVSRRYMYETPQTTLLLLRRTAVSEFAC